MHTMCLNLCSNSLPTVQVLLLKYVVKDKSLPVLVNVIWPSLLRVGKFLNTTENPGLVLGKGAEVPEEEHQEEEEDALLTDKVAMETSNKVLDIKRSQHRSASSFLHWASAEVCVYRCMFVYDCICTVCTNMIPPVSLLFCRSAGHPYSTRGL